MLNNSPEQKGREAAPAENGAQFIVQESTDAFDWYDHPYLPEFGTQESAILAMVCEQASESIYKYRVIKRTESVVHVSSQIK